MLLFRCIEDVELRHHVGHGQADAVVSQVETTYVRCGLLVPPRPSPQRQAKIIAGSIYFEFPRNRHKVFIVAAWFGYLSW